MSNTPSGTPGPAVEPPFAYVTRNGPTFLAQKGITVKNNDRLRRLRRDVRMSAISQWCHFFGDFIGLPEFDVEKLEYDLCISVPQEQSTVKDSSPEKEGIANESRAADGKPSNIGHPTPPSSDDAQQDKEGRAVQLAPKASALTTSVSLAPMGIAVAGFTAFQSPSMNLLTEPNPALPTPTPTNPLRGGSDPKEEDDEEDGEEDDEDKRVPPPLIYIPTIVSRLLVAVSTDRTVKENNWEVKLRRQFWKKSEYLRLRQSPLGQEPNLKYPNEPVLPRVHWEDMDLDDQVYVLHTICEWQFLWSADRWRSQLMKNADEGAAWRLEFIGLDGSDNKYWFFDDNRLWIQRNTPAEAIKARARWAKELSKAPTEKGTRSRPSRAIAALEQDSPGPAINGRGKKRKRIEEEPPSDHSDTENGIETEDGGRASRSKSKGGRGRGRGKGGVGRRSSLRGKPAEETPEVEDEDVEDGAEGTSKPTTKPRARGKGSRRGKGKGKGRAKGRASKVQKVEDDKSQEEEEAEELEAEVEEEAEVEDLLASPKTKVDGSDEPEKVDDQFSKGRRTRSSNRLSTLVTTADKKPGSERKAGRKGARPQSPENSLSPLSSVDNDRDGGLDKDQDGDIDMGDRQNKDIKEEEIEVDIPPLDMDNVAWTEWECICTIIPEWRAFADAFSTSNNPEELKLSHYIHDEVIPALMREYKEKEQKRMKEEAKIEAQNAARKRSTRLATREAEKEEAARAKALQDDDSRASRLEKRKAAEEAKLAAEEERKARLADREARFRAREEAARLRAEGLDPSEALKVLEGNPDLSPQKRKRTRYAETDAMSDDEEKSDGPKRKKKKAESSDEEYDPDEDSEASTEKDEPDSWYLNCEHCGKSGLDVDDGHKLVCCDQCEEWVHLKCLAKADREAGRPEKDYQEEDFLCGRCQRDPSRRKQEHTSGNWSDDEYDGGDGTTKRRRNRSPPKAANARSRATVKHTQSSPAIPSGSSLTPKAKAPTGFSSLHTTPNRAPAQSPAYRSQTIAGMPPSPVQAGTPFRSGPLRPPGTPAQHSLWGGPDHNTDPYPYITVWHQLVNDPSLMHRLPPVFQNHFGQLLGKIAPPPIDIYCNIANMIRNDMTGTRVEHLPQQFQPFFRPYVVPLHVRQAATRQAMLGGSGAATTPEQQQKLALLMRQQQNFTPNRPSPLGLGAQSSPNFSAMLGGLGLALGGNGSGTAPSAGMLSSVPPTTNTVPPVSSLTGTTSSFISSLGSPPSITSMMGAGNPAVFSPMSPSMSVTPDSAALLSSIPNTSPAVGSHTTQSAPTLPILGVTSSETPASITTAGGSNVIVPTMGTVAPTINPPVAHGFPNVTPLPSVSGMINTSNAFQFAPANGTITTGSPAQGIPASNPLQNMIGGIGGGSLNGYGSFGAVGGFPSVGMGGIGVIGGVSNAGSMGSLNTIPGLGSVPMAGSVNSMHGWVGMGGFSGMGAVGGMGMTGSVSGFGGMGGGFNFFQSTGPSTPAISLGATVPQASTSPSLLGLHTAPVPAIVTTPPSPHDIPPAASALPSVANIPQGLATHGNTQPTGSAITSSLMHTAGVTAVPSSYPPTSVPTTTEATPNLPTTEGSIPSFSPMHIAVPVPVAAESTKEVLQTSSETPMAPPSIAHGTDQSPQALAPPQEVAIATTTSSPNGGATEIIGSTAGMDTGASVPDPTSLQTT